jgi:predicted nucleic acid-binding protein
VIVDTNYVGALVERDASALALAREADGSVEPVRLPTAVIWELFYGLGKLENREHSSTLRRKYSSITNGMATAEMDGSVARRAGELRGKHKASDSLRDLDGADSIVAAHGMAVNEPVATNDGDFQDVDGLEVVTY